ncbi:hypothetical protein FRC00_006556 [Tulasnella sp. 408]|nr:hypothetical protein FRC00_006556 [Tulasnella sp. 408]
MQLSAVLSLVALVASVTAVAVPNSIVDSSLTRRQDGCNLYCDPLNNVNIECRAYRSCLCSGRIAALMYACATCKFQHDNTQYAALQQEMDRYSADCAANNYPVGALPIQYCSACANA